MKTLLTAAVFLSVGVAPAGDAKSDAVRKERARYEGTWRLRSLVVNGQTIPEESCKRIRVVNHLDGTWEIRVDDNVAVRGTSAVDPAARPRTVDLTPREGPNQGKTSLGIYELDKDSRRVCLAPAGQKRPTEFASSADSGHILATLKREKR